MSTKRDAASSGRSMVVLAASLVLVYTVFFGYQQPIDPLLEASAQGFDPAPRLSEDLTTEGEETVRIEEKSIESENVEIAQVQIAEKAALVADAVRNSIPQKQETDSQLSIDGKKFFSFQELFEPTEDSQEIVKQQSNTVVSSQNTTNRIPLANTYEWVGNLRSIVDFGLQNEVEYILKTVQNSHYVYLGKRDEVVLPRILEMGGSVVEIEGKNAISQYSLFGDRVMQISTERYNTKFKKVIFIVFFEQTRDAWFVQVDQDYYDLHADDIRLIFDERYDW